MIASIENVHIKRLLSFLSYSSYTQLSTFVHEKSLQLIIRQLQNKILGLRHLRYRFIAPLVDLIGKLRSGYDAKTAVNRLCRTITFVDVIGSSIGSIFYGSPNQITTVQHTVTAIWVWTGVPAAFVALRI